VRFLDEPFSTMPALHDWCNTHFYRLTSMRKGSAISNRVPSPDLSPTTVEVPTTVASVLSKYMRGQTPSQKPPTRFKTLILSMFTVTCSAIEVYRQSRRIRGLPFSLRANGKEKITKENGTSHRRVPPWENVM